jgi:AraC-like DNA-binding protein
VFIDVRDSGALLGIQPSWFEHHRFAIWSGGRDLVGWVLWGHFADDDAAAGKDLWVSLAGRIAQPYDFVLDLRALQSISSGAYALIREFAVTRKPGLRRMAVLFSEATTGGAIQLGLFVMRPPKFPWRSLPDYAQTIAWLERPDAAAVLEAVDGRTRARVAEAAPLARVRTLLAQDPDSTAESVARALGVSVRSLQRTLTACNTTLSAEHDRTRVVRAVELLRDPDAKLEAIAAAVGCADRRSLNRLFRRVTGESPADFRRRNGLPAPGALLEAD